MSGNFRRTLTKYDGMPPPTAHNPLELFLAMDHPADPRTEFVQASVWHGSLDRANAILAAHPDLAGSDIHIAALLGDDAAVRRFLALDPSSAAARSTPLGWDALTHLCFSRYLRLDHARSDAFVRAATALLDAGAPVDSGFWDNSHQPQPEWESALYGAAGVAHHAGITRLLLDRGADPNDEETPYHAPETHDNAALKVLVESGKLTAGSLATMLLRKADWHDHDGIRYLLEHGADPNRLTRWHKTALHQALRRDNHVDTIRLLLDFGADPAIPNGREGQSAAAIAARRGRSDVLDLFESRGVLVELGGVDRLIAACARDNGSLVEIVARRDPELVLELRAEGGTLLGDFAGTGNTNGIRHLLALGVNVQAPYPGDAYFGIAKNSTALHVAAWRASHGAVRFLIDRGAPVDSLDAEGRTPLTLAVRACVDSYWAYRRSPDSVDVLLRAGASAAGIAFPCGYAEVDELLMLYGRESN